MAVRAADDVGDDAEDGRDDVVDDGVILGHWFDQIALPWLRVKERGGWLHSVY